MPKHNKTRNKFEQSIDKQLKDSKVSYSYESEKITYVVPSTLHSYTPDFVITTGRGTKFYVETKGIWDLQDRQKHLYLRQQYPELDIRFVFYKANQKIRKGSKTTYADICEGRGPRDFKGLTWLYSEKEIPKEWLM